MGPPVCLFNSHPMGVAPRACKPQGQSMLPSKVMGRLVDPPTEALCVSPPPVLGWAGIRGYIL
jgi:hypothetical protein